MSEQSLISTKLKDGEKIGNIVKHDNYWSFAYDTHQSSTSEQSLIDTEHADREENQKHSKT